MPNIWAKKDINLFKIFYYAIYIYIYISKAGVELIKIKWAKNVINDVLYFFKFSAYPFISTCTQTIDIFLCVHKKHGSLRYKSNLHLQWLQTSFDVLAI